MDGESYCPHYRAGETKTWSCQVAELPKASQNKPHLTLQPSGILLECSTCQSHLTHADEMPILEWIWPLETQILPYHLVP